MALIILPVYLILASSILGAQLKGVSASLSRKLKLHFSCVNRVLKITTISGALGHGEQTEDEPLPRTVEILRTRIVKSVYCGDKCTYCVVIAGTNRSLNMLMNDISKLSPSTEQSYAGAN